MTTWLLGACSENQKRQSSAQRNGSSQSPSGSCLQHPRARLHLYHNYLVVGEMNSLRLSSCPLLFFFTHGITTQWWEGVELLQAFFMPILILLHLWHNYLAVRGFFRFLHSSSSPLLHIFVHIPSSFRIAPSIPSSCFIQNSLYCDPTVTLYDN